jgi:hypothetical protein
MAVMDPQLLPLIPTFVSAELLTCGVIRAKTKKTEPDWAFNAFSVLTFLDAPLPPELKLQHITPALENAPGGDYRLFVSKSTLTAHEALSLLSFKDRFKDPRAPVATPPIESCGTWVGPEFVGREEHPARACVAALEPFWLTECWRAGASAIDDEMDGDSADWLRRRIRLYTGVMLDERRERLGNFLVVMPDRRHRMRITWTREDKVGVEVRDRTSRARRFTLVVRGQREGSLVGATARNVPAGLHVFELPEVVDHRAVELYDAETGYIVDRDAGVPLREVWAVGHIITTHTDIAFKFKEGDTVRVQSEWGTTVATRSGARPDWEERLASMRDRERKEALRARRQLFVYRGSEAERRLAIADLQGILRNEVHDYVKIWDPYFGAREAAEFLGYVFDTGTRIEILTSLEAIPFERTASQRPERDAFDRYYERMRKVVGRAARRLWADPLPQPAPPLRSVKRAELQKVLGLLRRPNASTVGLQDLRCGIGGAVFHDRFIVTRGRCWQLGCSFNQIGRVMSTVLDFPYPSLIEREFDHAFASAREVL